MIQLFAHVGDNGLAVACAQFLVHPAKRNSDHIAMVKFGAEVLAEFEPYVVDKIDIFRP